MPTDRFTIKIYGDLFHRQDDSLDELFIPKSRFGNISKSEAKHINLETPARVKQTSSSGALDLKYEFDKFDATSATTFRRAKKDGLYDEDFGSKITYLDPDHYGLVTFLNSKNDTVSEELRFSGTDEQSFKWVSGLYYENEKQVFGPIGDQYGDGGRMIVEDWPSVNRARRHRYSVRSSIRSRANLMLRLAAGISRSENTQRSITFHTSWDTIPVRPRFRWTKKRHLGRFCQKSHLDTILPTS